MIRIFFICISTNNSFADINKEFESWKVNFKKIALKNRFLKKYSKSNFIIERGMRVAQIVFNKFERVNLISKLELDPTLRGAGGFGSTGIKE